MKIFTSKTMKLALVAVLGLTASTQAFAGEKWSNHTVKVISTPTGGKVYVNNDAEKFQESDLKQDECTEHVSVMVTDLSAVGAGKLYAAAIFSQPAEGWHAAGFAKDADNDGIFDQTKDLEVSAVAGETNNAFYSLINLNEGYATECDSETAAQAGTFPENPSSTFFALFAKAVAYVKDGVGGTIETSNLCNNIGDNVTFKATAGQGLKEDGTTIQYYFINWTDADGQEIGTTEEYTIENITVPTKIYAVFSDTKPSSGINDIIVDNQEADGPAYDVFGRRVTSEYKGIVIRNGKKYIQR